jgi:hypothetical protein
MTIHDRIAQARHDRSARGLVRARRAALIRELSTYSSSADRNEIQLMAGRSSMLEEATTVLNILDQLTTDARRDDTHRIA